MKSNHCNSMQLTFGLTQVLLFFFHISIRVIFFFGKCLFPLYLLWFYLRIILSIRISIICFLMISFFLFSVSTTGSFGTYYSLCNPVFLNYVRLSSALYFCKYTIPFPIWDIHKMLHLFNLPTPVNMYPSPELPIHLITFSCLTVIKFLFLNKIQTYWETETFYFI